MTFLASWFQAALKRDPEEREALLLGSDPGLLRVTHGWRWNEKTSRFLNIYFTEWSRRRGAYFLECEGASRWRKEEDPSFLGMDWLHSLEEGPLEPEELLELLHAKTNLAALTHEKEESPFVREVGGDVWEEWLRATATRRESPDEASSGKGSFKERPPGSVLEETGTSPRVS